MFGRNKDIKGDKSLSDAHETLGLWQNLSRKTLEFFASHRVDLRTLPDFDLSSLIDVATRKDASPEDSKEQLEKLRHSIEHVRLEETKTLNQYILGLRGLLWSSISQVMNQRGSAYQESLKFDSLKDRMVRALDSDDLLQLKVAVKDWIVLQNQISQDRKKQMDDSQQNYQRQLARLQNELYQTQSELKLDGLTQVYNRKAFDNEILKCLQISQLSGRVSTLMLFDIDHFKSVNDTYGHPIGDKVLQAFAKLIVQNFPTRTDFVARYGGEEFVVLMNDCDLEEAKGKAQKFVNLLRKTTLTFGSVSLKVTVSIGVASSGPFETVEDWIKRSDDLLYKAKEDGRDCFIIDNSAA